MADARIASAPLSPILLVMDQTKILRVNTLDSIIADRLDTLAHSRTVIDTNHLKIRRTNADSIKKDAIKTA